MSVYKRFNTSDIFGVSYLANKSWSIDESETDKVNLYRGTKITNYSFNPNDIIKDPITNGYYERLIYNSINHMFYQRFDSGFFHKDNFNLYNYPTIEFSNIRNIEGYIKQNDNFINNFPIVEGDQIVVISIRPNIYGNKILPNTVEIINNSEIYTDDGYGNLYHNTQQIGNVFYEYGIIVITNQNYTSIGPTSLAISNKYFEFEFDEANKNMNLTTGNIGNFDWSKLTILEGKDSSYFSHNNLGILSLNTSVQRIYIVDLRIEDGINSSNIFTVTVKLIDPPCDLIITEIQ